MPCLAIAPEGPEVQVALPQVLQAGSERRTVRQPRICPRHSGLQVQVMHHSLWSATGARLRAATCRLGSYK